jgi:hypothetical protein
MKDKERIHEQKKCPKCGNGFLCSASVRCWCFEYELPPQTLEKLQETWSSCLCPDCLKAFAKPE